MINNFGSLTCHFMLNEFMFLKFNSSWFVLNGYVPSSDEVTWNLVVVRHPEPFSPI